MTPSLRAAALVAAGLALGAAGCGSRANATKAATAAPRDAGEVAMLDQRGIVKVTTRDGRTLELSVEIASDDATRARGLMFRKTMPEMSGMIFAFPADENHNFWMRNTYLPLDMLFARSDGVIVGIVEYAEPLTTTGRSVGKPSRYVLEVNGGWCQRHGVAAGDRLSLTGDYVVR